MDEGLYKLSKKVTAPPREDELPKIKADILRARAWARQHFPEGTVENSNPLLNSPKFHLEFKGDILKVFPMFFGKTSEVFVSYRLTWKRGHVMWEVFHPWAGFPIRLEVPDDFK
jgi:hypothetical protein